MTASANGIKKMYDQLEQITTDIVACHIDCVEEADFNVRIELTTKSFISKIIEVKINKNKTPFVKQRLKKEYVESKSRGVGGTHFMNFVIGFLRTVFHGR